MRLPLLSLLVPMLTTMVFSDPGDIIRSQSISGQPANGIRGLARDWGTDRIWVAGPEDIYNVMYTSLDIETLAPDAWKTASGSLHWVFDIGYGYDMGGTVCLLMNDQQSPFTKLIDPSDGSYLGNLPDYYSAADYTNGCAVDTSSNSVYLSSHGNPEIVLFDGTSFNLFGSAAGAKNMGAAVGWDHIFIIRTDPYYSIEVYDPGGGFVQSIPLSGWTSSNYVMGLACGREDVSGDNESLFFADFITQQVHEVEVGDYTGTSLQQTTWGQIKAGFDY